ncbi:hypothetical protein GCM10027290_11130 [Micromonospora sonneratiae]|uniref:Aminoglycoside adenylyltransferase domain-containing protein n=1 Tax=Micromonospora sonneratiae TaxID=1184706 RepID=A0ABW3YID2_9ACTN
MVVPPGADEAIEAYFAAVDAEAPGLVEGIYLVGSVALDDFHPGASDIDFVAVTGDVLSDADVAALERAHVALTPYLRRQFFDGLYVTWRDLGDDPARSRPGACVEQNRLRRRVAGTGDPVAWHTLASRGVTVRGPRREEVRIWTDRTVLAAWTHRNLDEYWRVWLRRSSRLRSRPGLATLAPTGPVWGVLGVSRLHYTLATGRITSKRGAGEYARQAFDVRWQRIVDECLRIRTGAPGRSRYRSPLHRRRDALDFVAMAIEDAHRIDDFAGPDVDE